LFKTPYKENPFLFMDINIQFCFFLKDKANNEMLQSIDISYINDTIESRKLINSLLRIKQKR